MLNKLYSWLANVLLSRVLGGKKTLILGWLVSTLGAWNVIVTTDTIQALCDTSHICLQGNATWGWICMMIGELTKLLRFATGQDYGDRKFIK